MSAATAWLRGGHPSLRGTAAARRGGAGSGVQPVHHRDVPGGRLHPTVYEGTVESIRAAADLVAQGRCLYCVPSSCISGSCISGLPGTIWRPLTEPASYYPWSVLWWATDDSDHVRAIVGCARAMFREAGLAASRGSDRRLTGRIDGGFDRPGRRQQMVFHPRQAHHAEQYDRRKQRY